MKFDTILRNAIHESNKVAYFKREFDNPYWKYQDFKKDFLEPLFQRIQKHKDDIHKEFEKQKTGLKSQLDKAKRNELDFYYSYLMRCMDKKGVDYKGYEKEQNEIWAKKYAEKLESLTVEDVKNNGLFKFYLKELNTLEGVLKELERPQQNIRKGDKPKRYTAKHYALSYLFELDLKGKHLPTNDGGFDQDKINKQGSELMGKEQKGNSGFMKAVREISNNYDRNKTDDLKQLSKNWRTKVMELSPNPGKLNQYLQDKGL